MTSRWIEETELAAIPANESRNSRTGERTPLVSVLMITFNHAPFVRAAVESVIAQKCDFDIEILIGEDCSTDGTRAICEELQAQYRRTIRLVTSDCNVGMHRNLARIWHRARGRYLAILEGDDYWSDRRKLDKQVELLESDRGAVLCGALARRIRRDSSGEWVEAGIIGPRAIRERYGVADLIPDYSFHTSTVLIRAGLVRFPEWFWDVYCADRPLYLLCAEQGSAVLLPEVVSTYRLHDGGVWSPSNGLKKATQGIALFERLNRHFDHRYEGVIRETLGEILWSYMAEAMAVEDFGTARALFSMAVPYRVRRLSSIRVRTIASAWTRVFLPPVATLADAVRGAVARRGLG